MAKTAVVPLEIDCRRVRTVLTTIVVALTCIHMISQALYLYSGRNYQLGLRRLFNLGEEANVPTWYASASLALCAVLLLVIGHARRQARDRYAAHWIGLAAIFAFLAIDEGAMLHETTIALLDPVVARFGYFGGYLYYAWVIPWGLFAAAVGVSYLRFLTELPFETRIRFVLAALLYVGGAAGTEMLEGRVDLLSGGAADARIPIVTLQEVLEMLGILVFIRALLGFAARNVGTIALSLVDPQKSLG